MDALPVPIRTQRLGIGQGAAAPGRSQAILLSGHCEPVHVVGGVRVLQEEVAPAARIVLPPLTRLSVEQQIVRCTKAPISAVFDDDGYLHRPYAHRHPRRPPQDAPPAIEHAEARRLHILQADAGFLKIFTSDAEHARASHDDLQQFVLRPLFLHGLGCSLHTAPPFAGLLVVDHGNRIQGLSKAFASSPTVDSGRRDIALEKDVDDNPIVCDNTAVSREPRAKAHLHDSLIAEVTDLSQGRGAVQSHFRCDLRISTQVEARCLARFHDLDARLPLQRDSDQRSLDQIPHHPSHSCVSMHPWASSDLIRSVQHGAGCTQVHLIEKPHVMRPPIHHLQHGLHPRNDLPGRCRLGAARGSEQPESRPQKGPGTKVIG